MECVGVSFLQDSLTFVQMGFDLGNSVHNGDSSGCRNIYVLAD